MMEFPKCPKYLTMRELYDQLEIGDQIVINQNPAIDGIIIGTFTGYNECPHEKIEESDESDVCYHCFGMLNVIRYNEKLYTDCVINSGKLLYTDCVINSFKKTYVTEIIKPKPFLSEKEMYI